MVSPQASAEKGLPGEPCQFGALYNSRDRLAGFLYIYHIIADFSLEPLNMAAVFL